MQVHLSVSESTNSITLHAKELLFASASFEGEKKDVVTAETVGLFDCSYFVLATRRSANMLAAKTTKI